MKGRNKSQCHPVTSILYNNKVFSDDESIANALNDYFSTIGKKLCPNINPAVNPLEHLDLPVCQSIFFSPVFVSEILEYIAALKSDKAPGSDGIPVKLVKSASHIIAPVLAYIFNVVFSTGSYPEALKIAKVIPLFKKGKSDLPENYRPISLLPCFN